LQTAYLGGTKLKVQRHADAHGFVVHTVGQEDIVGGNGNRKGACNGSLRPGAAGNKTRLLTVPGIVAIDRINEESSCAGLRYSDTPQRQ
jgi:hypothetical protein